jgi:3-oxoacyl-[acyl-carrier protein] reductase
MAVDNHSKKRMHMTVNFGLNGRSALVTGGSRGIGRATVLALAREGASVTACYAHESAAVASLSEELESLGADAQLIQADVTDEADVARLVEAAGARSSQLDILVNNAGVVGHESLQSTSLEEWRRVLDTNLTGAFLIIKSAYKLLRDDAAIVNVGSAGSLRGMANRTPYMTSKAGVLGFTRSLCQELGPRGIRVNTVAAGYTDTDRMTDMPEERRATILAKSPLGRVAHPDEIAAVVLFLASDAARYITGEALYVDGGMS